MILGKATISEPSTSVIVWSMFCSRLSCAKRLKLLPEFSYDVLQAFCIEHRGRFGNAFCLDELTTFDLETRYR